MGICECDVFIVEVTMLSGVIIAYWIQFNAIQQNMKLENRMKLNSMNCAHLETGFGGIGMNIAGKYECIFVSVKLISLKLSMACSYWSNKSHWHPDDFIA